MPHVIIIAGPNGAGKTTAAPALLNESLKVDHFVNADTIALGLSAYAPKKSQSRQVERCLNGLNSSQVKMRTLPSKQPLLVVLLLQRFYK